MQLTTDDVLRAGWVRAAEDWLADRGLRASAWSASGWFAAGGVRYGVRRADGGGWGVEPVPYPRAPCGGATGDDRRGGPGTGGPGQRLPRA